MDRLCLIQGENKVPASQRLPILLQKAQPWPRWELQPPTGPLQKSLNKQRKRERSSISEIYLSSPFCPALIRESAQWLPSKGKIIQPDFILFVCII